MTMVSQQWSAEFF